MTHQMFAAHRADATRQLQFPVDMEAESYHRIANSLQMVASIISIESRQLADDDARHSLETASRRIQAIAGVHRKLYAAPRVDVLDVADYLSSLVAELKSVCVPCLNGGDLIGEFMPLQSEPDTATCLGLIATEATLNACKYAYKDGRRGDVVIRLRSESASWSRLEVIDSGIGMSHPAGVPQAGFGTWVIQAAASRIGGNFRYEDNRPGTRFVLSFPRAGKA